MDEWTEDDCYECEPDPVDGYAFCDNYDPHDPHRYTAINCNVYACPGLTPEQLAEIETESEATCEHGLSAWLCEGPNHYPDDSRY